MRLWSIHPRYLDAKGLVALWREGLLAQNVLLGNTKGYKNHPQLIRFKNSTNPVGAIAEYLKHIVNEANKRGYSFDRSKISDHKFKKQINVCKGQIEYEFNHLLSKLNKRKPDLFEQLKNTKLVKAHPMFTEIDGIVEDWEIL